MIYKQNFLPVIKPFLRNEITMIYTILIEIGDLDKNKKYADKKNSLASCLHISNKKSVYIVLIFIELALSLKPPKQLLFPVITTDSPPKLSF